MDDRAGLVRSTTASDNLELIGSLHAWVAAADDADEHDLCLALVRALGENVDDADRLRQALSLLRLRNASAALRALPSPDGPLPAAGSPFTATDLLLGACQAATGDITAYRWLLLAATASSGDRAGWFALHLVAVVDDLRGDYMGADRSWRIVVERYGIVTPAVISRLVVAQVSQRKGEDEGEVVRRLGEAATSLERTAHSLARDARPALAAADELTSRGDVAGARLLLHLLPRRSPVAPAIRERDATLTPARVLWRRRVIVCAVALAGVVAAVLLDVPAAALPLGIPAQYAWRRWMPVPGLDRADSGAYRAIRGVFFHAGSGRGQEATPDGGFLALAVMLGSAAGFAAGSSVYSTTQGWGPAGDVVAWTIGLAVPVTAFLATLRWSRARQARAPARTRAEEVQATLRAVSSCRCWDGAAFVDEIADAYAHHHLVDHLDPAIAEAVTIISGRLGRGVRIRRCPRLGLLWLHAPLTDDGASLLLRGALPLAEETNAESTGFYL